MSVGLGALAAALADHRARRRLDGTIERERNERIRLNSMNRFMSGSAAFDAPNVAVSASCRTRRCCLPALGVGDRIVFDHLAAHEFARLHVAQHMQHDMVGETLNAGCGVRNFVFLFDLLVFFKKKLTVVRSFFANRSGASIVTNAVAR